MASATYRFDEFRLDPASRELWHGDRELALPRKVFDCILYLVEHRDRAIERDELFSAVWGNVQLSDGVLAQTILEARRALQDTGDEQRFIKTIRGFGYHWVAPVESVADTLETPAAPAPTTVPADDARSRSRGRSSAPWAILALVALGVTLAGTLYLRRHAAPGAPEGPPLPRAAGEIALLLPVELEAGAEHAWVRLGLMDLMATRLVEAGQAMVPSDTVIALLQGVSPESDPVGLDRLITATGARLVLAAEARVTGARWTVSLRSLRGASPPLVAVGEAHDVLAAARTATDRMTTALGLDPASEPHTDPALQELLQRIEAAVLAGQTDAALSIIEQASPGLRRHPEIRLQAGRIAYDRSRLDAAQAVFESLVDDTSAENDPTLRARALNGLAAVHIQREDPAAAEPLLQEAASLFEARRMYGHLGSVQRYWGHTAQLREDFDAAWRHYAQARRALESVGDTRRLGRLDINMGLLKARRGRYAEALRYHESALERLAAVRDLAGELLVRSNMIAYYFKLLDLQTASAMEPRMAELLDEVSGSTASVVCLAEVNLANLRHAVGEIRAARAGLGDVLGATEREPIPPLCRMAALLTRIEWKLPHGEALARAADLVAEAVDTLATDPTMYDARARAWRLLIRIRLALGDREAAGRTLADMTAWADRVAASAPRVYAALAAAEMASDNDDEAAATAFERALGLAVSSHVPLYLLHVAQSYVPWLLRHDARPKSAAERASAVVARLALYADRNYGVALLQLRVYHALGPASAWRAGLARARSLAGERQIPAELARPPIEARLGERGLSGA